MAWGGRTQGLLGENPSALRRRLSVQDTCMARHQRHPVAAPEPQKRQRRPAERLAEAGCRGPAQEAPTRGPGARSVDVGGLSSKSTSVGTGFTVSNASYHAWQPCRSFFHEFPASSETSFISETEDDFAVQRADGSTARSDDSQLEDLGDIVGSEGPVHQLFHLEHLLQEGVRLQDQSRDLALKFESAFCQDFAMAAVEGLLAQKNECLKREISGDTLCIEVESLTCEATKMCQRLEAVDEAARSLTRKNDYLKQAVLLRMIVASNPASVGSPTKMALLQIQQSGLEEVLLTHSCLRDEEEALMQEVKNAFQRLSIQRQARVGDASRERLRRQLDDLAHEAAEMRSRLRRLSEGERSLEAEGFRLRRELIAELQRRPRAAGEASDWDEAFHPVD